MVCRPATQFCCGCSVRTGVIIILIVHLLECIFVTTVTGVFCIGKAPSFINYNLFEDMTTQTVFAGFHLAGIVIVLMGLYGVWVGMEPCLRIYWLYAIASFSIDVGMCVKNFLFHPTCDNLPTIMAEQGRAWACGASRVYDTMAFALILSIPGYFLYVVHSYCLDMAEGGSAPDLSDLDANRPSKKWAQAALMEQYGSVLPSGMFHTKGTEYTSAFDAVASSGLSGGAPIFNGKYHEMEYPPPYGSTRSFKY
mmetsp:Transcript_130160/g.236700  ORF Transcript_130160/g.236700 Transcript_130160/m.236700 type:complete len:252 (-) Transcript_130160:91-846(-)